MKQRQNTTKRLLIEEREYRDMPVSVPLLIASLAELSKTFGDTLEVYPDGYGYEIRYFREETDKEYNARQSKIKKAREKAEERRKKEQEKVLAELAKREQEERALYEELKKKYS